MDSASSAEPMVSPADADGPAATSPSPGPSNVGLRTLLPVAAVVIVVDQLSKIWAVEALGQGRTIDLFWTARFKLVRNEGAAFSLGSSLTPFITVAAIAVSVAVVVAGRHHQRRSVLVALGLVLGGAMGNVIDRLVRQGDGFLRGAVVDFIDFQWWPVFNVADIGIVVGGVLLVLFMSERPPADARAPTG